MMSKVFLWLVYMVSLYYVVFWMLVYFEKGVDKKPKRKRLKELPMVSIVIPAFNEEKCIEESIRSIFILDYPKDKFELLVVNDGSTDNTGAIAKKVLKEYTDKGFFARYFEKENEGSKHAPANYALERAKGEYYVCLDADSLIINKKMLKEMLVYFAEDDIAAVLPNMKVHNPTSFIEKIQYCEYLVNMFYKKLMSLVDCVHVTPGPFSVYRTDILRKVGGYRAAHLVEDLELTYRLQRHNYKIVQLLDVSVYTKVPKTFGALHRQRIRWFNGSFRNSLDYKDMIFSKKYGDFGFMMLPSVLASGIISLSLLSTSLYFFLEPKISFLYHSYLVGFDWMTFINSYKWNINIYDYRPDIFIQALIMFAITFFVLKLSYKFAKEKFIQNGVVSTFGFLYIFYIVMGVAWTNVIYNYLKEKMGLKNKISWVVER